MIRQRRPVVDHGVRRGDRANPHQGDCTDTLCPVCGCCQHCAEDGHRPGCSDSRCNCPPSSLPGRTPCEAPRSERDAPAGQGTAVELREAASC